MSCAVQSASAGEVADQLGHVCAGGRDVSVLCRGFSGTVSGASRGQRGCTRQAGVASGTRFCTANNSLTVGGTPYRAGACSALDSEGKE